MKVNFVVECLYRATNGFFLSCSVFAPVGEYGETVTVFSNSHVRLLFSFKNSLRSRPEKCLRPEKFSVQ